MTNEHQATAKAVHFKHEVIPRSGPAALTSYMLHILSLGYTFITEWKGRQCPIKLKPQFFFYSWPKVQTAAEFRGLIFWSLCLLLPFLMT